MMGSAFFAWILAGVAVVVAVALYVRLRQLVVDVGQARVVNEKLEAELRSSRDQLERASAKQRRKGDELAELRKKYEKLRKRSEPGEATSRPSTGFAGVTERDLEEARQARDRAREQVEALTIELEALRAAHAVATATPPPPPEDSISGAEADELRSAVARANDAAEASRRAAAEAEAMTVRLKKRLDAQELAYVSLRGELEAKKDRLTTQNEEIERLRALKVAFLDAGDEQAPVDANDVAHVDDIRDSTDAADVNDRFTAGEVAGAAEATERPSEPAEPAEAEPVPHG